jgi:tetratricopeptide (TPR) repeat protein
VLLTSRRAEWPRSLGVAPIPLGVLAPVEAVALLRQHRPDLAADDADLAAVAMALGCLPLALHLAGSYLERYRHESLGRPAAYLAALGLVLRDLGDLAGARAAFERAIASW